jgi:hypothetical protein
MGPISIACPLSALPSIAADLRKFGVRVVFDDQTCTSGRLDHLAGALNFSHDGKSLKVEIAENNGHFPDLLLIGGIRQFVEEAVSP